MLRKFFDRDFGKICQSFFLNLPQGVAKIDKNLELKDTRQKKKWDFKRQSQFLIAYNVIKKLADFDDFPLKLLQYLQKMPKPFFYVAMDFSGLENQLLS